MRPVRSIVVLIQRLVLAGICLALVLCCASPITQAANTNSAITVPNSQIDGLRGYLSSEAFANSQVFIPPPPSEGSIALALDQEISQKSLRLQGSPQWQQAAQDADLGFPQVAEVFSYALDVPITQRDTPRLYQLMHRTMIDTLASTSRVKDYYHRVRPFLSNQHPICTPNQIEELSQQWSYPSGHTATGWAWALILSEIASDRSDALLTQGRAFGQSRVVCNVHWHSDVIEGRTLGAAVVAQLHSNSEFLVDLNGAKAEWRTMKNEDSESSLRSKVESSHNTQSVDSNTCIFLTDRTSEP